jgi:pilus assembly protein FimV
VAPKVVEPEPTLVDEILGNPLYLAGGAAVLLALGGLGFMAQRRRKSPAAAFSEKQDELGEVTGRMATPQAPSPDTGDFTALAASQEIETEQQSDDVDPISEADLFLNFGRDAQAEEVLKEALLRTPDDHRIHLKLLGIYANRVDVNSFATIARQLQDSGDEPAWEQAAAMGRKMEPNNPMYGGASIEDAASATMQTMVLNTAPEIASEAAVPEVDFDLGAGDAGKTMILNPEEMPAAQEMVMDFDLTSTSPSLVVPDMDFDITSTSPSMAALAEPEASPEASSVPEEPAESGLPNLDDLVFDVTSMESAKPAAEQEEPKKVEHDDADVMEFSLDFPVEEEAAKPAAPAAPAADIGLSGISLNLDDVGTTAQAGAEVVKDERWHEVATKLDLARAYQEMGDQTGAREILEEVLRDGDSEQQDAAQALIDQLI